MIHFHLYCNAQPIGTAVIHDRLQITDSTITNKRMRLNTVPSSCVLPKLICPGHLGDTGVFYKTYTYTNESINNECITVRLQVNCSPQIFCAAYLGTFNPQDVCINYLADPGVSISNGGSDSMSFDVAAGAKYCIVVSGVFTEDTCESYTLTIEQYATSWHGSLTIVDSTQSQRLHLDGVRYTCQNIKALCAIPPTPGIVFHDGYHYKNTTPNDICIRATLKNNSTDTASLITCVAYLNSCDSANVCYNIAADAGISAGSNDSLWYSFLVPAGSNSIIMIYSQKDSVFCEDYEVKLEADYTAGVQQPNSNAESFIILPNPVSQGEHFIVKYNNADYNMVDVYDVNARKIFSQQISEGRKQINISTSLLSKGIYLIKLSGEKNSVTRKVIVD